MATRKEYIKTKYPGVYFKEDSITKIKTFIARVKVNGIDTEQIVGYSNDNYKTNASIAFQRRTELVNQFKAGKSIKQTKELSLQELFEEYIEYKKSTISDKWYKNQKNFFNNDIYFSSSIKSKKISQITLQDLQAIVNSMIQRSQAINPQKTYSGRTIKTVKEILSPMYKYAVNMGLLDNNIAERIVVPKFDNKRYFTLEDEQMHALYEKILQIPMVEYRVMYLFKFRGRRNKEVLTLEWTDLDLKNREYTIRDKNSKITETSKYYIDDELMHHLLQLPNRTGFLFVNPDTNKPYVDFSKRLWNKLKDEIGIEDMRIYDFRHLIGYKLINEGVSIEVISRVLGHKNIRTTQRYSTMTKKMAKEGIDEFLNILNGNK